MVENVKNNGINKHKTKTKRGILTKEEHKMN